MKITIELNDFPSKDADLTGIELFKRFAQELRFLADCCESRDFRPLTNTLVGGISKSGIASTINIEGHDSLDRITMQSTEIKAGVAKSIGFNVASIKGAFVTIPLNEFDQLRNKE